MECPSLVAVALGGALGATLRWWLSELWPCPPGAFPASTLVINTAGSFLLGTLAALELPSLLKLFLATGFCGGFTTFSTFSLQTFQLLRGTQPAAAFANIALSVLICLTAVAIGYSLASAARRL